MKVYVVGDNGPEHNSIRSIHRTYEGALKAWNKLRRELLANAKSSLKRDSSVREMYQRIVDNLSCEDPEKIDNYPHETPYIVSMMLLSEMPLPDIIPSSSQH